MLIRNISIWQPEGVIENAVIAVGGGAILYAGSAEKAGSFMKNDDDCLDGRGGLAMPGLCNAHTHLAMTLLRGLGGNHTLSDWLEGFIFPAEDNLTPHDVYVGTQLALCELMRFGVTSYVDMYSFMDQVAMATIESGLSGIITRGIVGDGESPAFQERLDESIALFKDYNGAADGRVRVMFAPHAEYTTTPKAISRILGAAASLGTGINIHASETLKEHEECLQRHGMTPVAYLGSLGVFDIPHPVVLAHCVAVSSDDIKIMAKKNVVAAHCPVSNLKLACGVAPVPEMIRAGVNVAIATDGVASNNTHNLWEEIRLVSLIHKGTGTLDPTLFDENDAIAMATETPSRVLGLGATSLSAGQPADIVILNTDGPHWQPLRQIHSHPAYAAQGSDVYATIAGGKPVYLGGEYLTMDYEKIRYEVNQAVLHLY